jgi:hypothetical protein
MFLKLSSIGFLVGTLCFTGCNDDALGDGGTSSTAESVSNKIRGKKWNLSSMVANPGMKNPADTSKYLTDIYLISVRDCEKDDYTVFDAEGTITEYAGAIQCEAGDPPTTSTDTWKLSDDLRSLITKSPLDGTVTRKIVELTATSMTLAFATIEDDVSQAITVKMTVLP